MSAQTCYLLDTDTSLRTIHSLNQTETCNIAVSGGPALERINAEWIVEDPGGGNMAEFSDVWFEQAYAITADGARHGINSSIANNLEGGL